MSSKNIHPILNLRFRRVIGGGVVFEDNVFYSQEETKILKARKYKDIESIHLAKKIFKGVVISHVGIV